MDDSSREEENNTVRVLVATDCHLGYMEKDEVRRHDSFQAFEEICSIAEKKQAKMISLHHLVDFVLLGGDLFHENKPSRATLVKAIEILRRYCLNDRPVQFQVVSDQTVNFANLFGHVNYEDPHFNVGLPVFSIHGNHDDPAGVDNLSAVDILSACNLVNYFGKMDLGGSGVGQIALHPILIRKGLTSVALYGLGNIRDERLNRMFQTPHAVQWMRPEAQEGCQVSDWFNILVLHQNRVKTNPKNAINEHFLPRFLDFIVWGHEHECLVDPQEVPGMGFHITQPGSSVATSLIEGESKQKHVLLLEIKGNQYRPTKIPLNSVRPFEYTEVASFIHRIIYTEVVLKDEPDIDPNDHSSILEHLDKVVRKLIERSNQKANNGSVVKLPLVRVKVDYSGFMTINPQRFGQKYVGKVANPQDILIFSKSSKKVGKEAKFDDSERLRPEELNQQNIEALVAESNLKMEVLPVGDLDIALHNFVSKDDKMAFYSCVQYNLEETRNKIARDSDTGKFKEDDIVLKVGECLEERVKQRSARNKDDQPFSFSGQSLEDIRGKSSGVGSAVSFSDDEDATMLSASKSTAGKGRKDSSQSFRSSRDASEVSKTSSRGRGRGRGRGRASSSLKQTTLDASLGFRQSQRSASIAASASVRSIAEDDENVESPSSDEDAKQDTNVIDESSDDDKTVQGKGRKRAAPRGRGRASATAAKRGRKSDSSSSSLQRMLMDADEDDDDDDDMAKKETRPRPRVTRNYGALRR
ncbi:double-strand break repair protein MRE11 isoform X1 [Capsicum annuum]|uniref:double-strand break repair protein MRE11 isoform X1 n=1 Tax=Capsicum annuum TaxID=4072 RepID=UPI001FB15C00|nr:double-strand break repair protein MRE11 isoform X1 [Capsicum annuum]XP_047251911.1 double-strand break repair protein MRE11 isoform X1 [Capsicum annuum]